MKKYIWWWSASALAIFLLFVGVVSVQMLSPIDGKQSVHFITKARGSDAWGYLSTINPPKKWTTYYAHIKYSEWVKTQIKKRLPSEVSNLSQPEKASVIEAVCRTPAVLSVIEKLATQRIHYHILSEDCRKAKHQQHLAYGESDYSYLSRKAFNICLNGSDYKIARLYIILPNQVIRGYTLKYIAQLEDGQKPHITAPQKTQIQSNSPNEHLSKSQAEARARAELRAMARRAYPYVKNQRMIGMLIDTIKTQVSERWLPVSSSALACEIQIHLGPQGQLLGTPVVIRSSGDAHFDHLVVAAVEAAAPFVPPPGLPYSAFNAPIDLKMNAEDLNHG